VSAEAAVAAVASSSYVAAAAAVADSHASLHMTSVVAEPAVASRLPPHEDHVMHVPV
jgi:hypothetical protein